MLKFLQILLDGIKFESKHKNEFMSKIFPNILIRMNMQIRMFPLSSCFVFAELKKKNPQC